MAATGRLFLTPTLVTAQRRQLNATGSAAASNTKFTQAALAVATLTVRANPEVTSSAATTIPPAPATFAGVGWETVGVGLDSLGDGGVTRAATVPVILSWTSSTAGTVGFTVILFAGDDEIGRGTLSAATTTSAAPYTVNVAVNAGVAFNAGDKLQVMIFVVLPVNVGISAITYTLNYGTSATTGTNIAPVTYSIAASRSGSDSTGTTEAGSRTVSTVRTATDNGAWTEMDAATRVVAYARRGTDTNPALTDSASRSATFRPIATQSTGVTETATRTQTDFRRATDQQAVITESAVRQLIKSITATHTEQVALAVEQHTVTYGRTAAHYFVPTDPPLLNPTKVIAGTVRLRANGNVYTGVATVVLVRDSDGLEIATTESDPIDGTYRFYRNSYDTETYTTRIKREDIAGQPYEAISRNGLVPV